LVDMASEPCARNEQRTERRLQQDRGLVEAISRAYSQPKPIAYDYPAWSAWRKESLAGVGQEFAETRALMGDDYSRRGMTA